MRIIENDFLRAEISDHGAELSALFDKTNNRSVLWTADPAFWGRHAPVLFPFVGRCFNGTYRHNGKEYTMEPHGFARNAEFACIRQTPVSVVHRLCSTPETKAVFPFDFTLVIAQTLVGNTLQVRWMVENTGDDTMYFSIGGHPGFMCPVLPGTKQTDYMLSFPGKDTLTCKFVDVATGTIDPDKRLPLELENGRMNITAHTFDHDALVFDDHQVETVGLLYPDGKPYITLHCPEFPSLGVWTKPANAAPFVCLEPWTGRCDNTGYTGTLADRYGEASLDAGKVFNRGYDITVD